MELVTANKFSLEQLTHAYNQTRIDYVVPMPMNVSRLREYTRIYNIDMGCSWIAKNGDVLYGLGMLGVRPNRAWITRLGVLPNGRRKGTGHCIMEALLDTAKQQKLNAVWLEVIKGNAPAHKLFSKLGFIETRDLIVARRPPQANEKNIGFNDNIRQVTTLSHEEALILLSHRKNRPNWLNETESFHNVKNLSGLLIELKNGGRGWVTYHAGLLQLTRIIVEVISGDPIEVSSALLSVLHDRHKRQDAITENLFDDEVWEGFQKVGYFESFRRIEMINEI
ncbi:MAG: GNAT family N-acetyltransferase [Chloroflexota bacterium]